MLYKLEYPYLIFTIEKETTIINFLFQFRLSKKTIHLMKQNKEVLLNNTYHSFETIMHAGDTLKVKSYEKDDGMYPPVKGLLDVVYEDDFILVVNKQSHINVYPDNQNKTDSLSNLVSYYYQSKNLDLPVRYIHRLDYDTTGLVLFVKCHLIQSLLDYSLSIKEIKRSYLTIVEGHIDQGKSKLIKAPVSIDRHHQSKMRVGRNGKDAKTYVKCLSSNEMYSLIECELLTGRKHQIRVHLSYIGHPILGDNLYGHKSTLINRQALHAYKLVFYHPILEKEITITCDLPEDMKKCMSNKDLIRGISI